MATTVDPLRVRSVMGRDEWGVPHEFGPDGWRLTHRYDTASVIVTAAEFDDGAWVHASIARADELPTYGDLTRLHAAVWGHDGYAYQVFAPVSEHVNIHEYALHLWGRADGRPALPEFARGGWSI